MYSNLLSTLHYRLECQRSSASGGNGTGSSASRCGAFLMQPHTNDRNPERRLRIGYVSPDFRAHVVGRNLLPLFRIMIASASKSCATPDAEGDGDEEFRRHCDHWRQTVGVGDEALAGMIRQDGVDILVDLAQHTARNRLLVFAR